MGNYIKDSVDIVLVPPVIDSIYAWDYMPLGLLTLVAANRSFGISTKIYKSQKSFIKDFDFQGIAKELLESNPKIIGFSTWCITYPTSLVIAREIKKQNPEIKIIFGGPQASILGNETLAEFDFVDFVLSGEADYTIPKLCKLLLTGAFSVSDFAKIPGLFYKAENNKIYSTPPFPVQDLDSLPVPAYDIVSKNHTLKLDVGRGCPYQCTYCSTNNFFSHKYRTKSPVRIVDEIADTYKNYGIYKFSFAHDLFTLKKQFVFEVCERLGKISRILNRKFKWTCSARIDSVTEEMLSAMAKAGCKAIFFGIESGSEKIQKSIQKKLEIGEVYKVAEICRKVGIKMYASFIFGFPDETKDDLEKSLHSIIKLTTNGAFVQVSELSLLPRTPLYKEFKDKLIYDGRYSNFSGSIFSAPEKELIIKYPYIFSSFYYLPVPLLEREQLHELTIIINFLSDFRETLFLLKTQIEYELEKNELIVIYKQYYEDLKNHIQNGLPVSAWLIQKLIQLIVSAKKVVSFKSLLDVFSYEAAKSMVQARFISQRILQMKQPERKSGIKIPANNSFV